MTTYIYLIVADLLAILGFFINTSDSGGKEGKHFKKITPPGWVVFSLMVISFLVSISDQYFKDIETKQQLLQKSFIDSLNAGRQRQDLEVLISSSKKIDAAQTLAIEKSNALNNYLRSQLSKQALQIDRELNPLENFAVYYKIIIPASQPKLLRYKERIIKRRSSTEPSMLLVDKVMLPDLNNVEERPFASFLHDIYAITSFRCCTSNRNDRESLAIHTGVSFSREYFNDDPKDPQYGDYTGTKFILLYQRKDDVFILTFEDLAPRQITRADMRSLKDFADKDVVCMIRPGSNPDNINYDINAAKCINFRLMSVTLETQLKKGRYLHVGGFQQTEENRDFREFRTRLEKDVVF